MIDNFTKVPNLVVEAFTKIRINGEATQCLWVIIRNTYGFHNEYVSISLGQISNITGINRPCVARALKRLKDLRCVIQKDNTYKINDQTQDWVTVIKKDNTNKVLSKKIINVIEKDNEPVIEKDNTLIKKIERKKERESQGENDIQTKESFYLADQMLKGYEYYFPNVPLNRNISEMAMAFKKLMQSTKHNREQVEYIIQQAFYHHYWRKCIYSLPEFIKLYPKLVHELV